MAYELPPQSRTGGVLIGGFGNFFEKNKLEDAY